MNLINYIKKEYNEFKLYHRNKYNISFHIFCGITYMSLFFILFNKKKNVILGLYLLLLLFTVSNIYIVILLSLILILTVNIISLNISKKSSLNKYIFGLIILFYFLPDLSHYLTREKTVMNINNITPFTIFINIFYLLPFSLMCLSNSS
jgi:hypothetical protein